MKIGILTVKDPAFHPNRRLMEAAQNSGHVVLLINPYQTVSIIADNRFSFVFRELEERPDVVMPRQGSPMGEYGLVLLRHFMKAGIPLVNGLEGVTIARNQHITLQKLSSAGLPVPDTVFVTSTKDFSTAVESLGGYPVVVKAVDGMGGDGIIRADRLTDGTRFLEKVLAERKGAVVQHFFPAEGRVDARLLVIGGKVAGSMTLTPSKGEFRSNINRSGKGTAADPPEAWMSVAIEAAAACSLEIAGVDLIVEKDGSPKIVEVNYAPGFRGLEAATGINIADRIIDYVTSANRP